MGLELELDAFTSEEIGETIAVWFNYRNTATSEDQAAVQTTHGPVEFSSSTQEFNSGDRQAVRGTCYLLASEFTKAELRAEGSVQLTDGTTYSVLRVHLVIRETKYRIDSVGEVTAGLIPCQIVSSVEKHRNTRGADPL